MHPDLSQLLRRLSAASKISPVATAALLAGCATAPEERGERRDREAVSESSDPFHTTDTTDSTSHEAATGAEPSAELAAANRLPRVSIEGVVYPAHVFDVFVDGVAADLPIRLYADPILANIDGDKPSGQATLIHDTQSSSHRTRLRTYLPLAVFNDGQTLLWVQVWHPDGSISWSKPIVATSDDVTTDWPNVHEVHYNTALYTFQGENSRICVPESEWGSCPTVAQMDQWATLEAVSFSADVSFPVDLNIAVCDPDDGFEGDCCYIAQIWNPAEFPNANPCNDGGAFVYWGIGRPFDAQQAEVAAAPGWAAPTRSTTANAQAGAHWLRVARGEHASVASFARLTLELMSLGAPADLITQATQAQADEVAHARLGFSVASQLLGKSVGAGPLIIDGALDRSLDVEHILTAAIVEGCIAETIACAQVRDAARRCTTPWLAAELRQVADDETRHAELSWALVRWLLDAHPRLHEVAVVAFQTPLPPLPQGAHEDPEWGVVAADTDAQTAERVHRTVIAPLAAQLLARA